MTSKVCNLQIGEEGVEDATKQHFSKTQAPVLGRAPPRSKTPVRPRPAATHHSARQASNPSILPVSQRATLRIVHGLGILGPKEAMTAKAAEALIKHFNEPLSDTDIPAIARLTNLDPATLRVPAGMQGPDGEAPEAMLSPC